jgi:hypothetical protein
MVFQETNLETKRPYNVNDCSRSTHYHIESNCEIREVKLPKGTVFPILEVALTQSRLFSDNETVIEWARFR